MYKKQQKTVIALFIISVMAILLFREGYATSPTVTIRVIPDQTKIYAGTDRILFTAHVRGLKNVTYTWKLTGPGKFEGDTAHSAVFYIPPDKIDKQSVKVIVAVIVSDDTGQQVAASVPLTILAKPKSSPASTPTPEDTPKSGMSLVTKTALGLGAVAALGGGIALLTSGGDTGGSDDSSNNPFTGSFKREHSLTIVDTRQTAYFTDIFNLTQNGTAITGDLIYNVVVDNDYCIGSNTTSVTGTVTSETSAVLTLEFIITDCVTSSGGRIPFGGTYYDGTYDCILIDNDSILRIEGENYYRQ